jgi:putative membrane protein insertion efficiency factor
VTTPAARPLVSAVRFYQQARAGRPSPCRFVPSCSTYAVEALEVHGAMKGVALTTWRLCRCQPFGTHGYDPVPERKTS